MIVRGIFEINPDDGTILNNMYVGQVRDLGFNPISRKLFFYGGSSDIWEIATDGTGLELVFTTGIAGVSGMAFTPTGDLILCAGGELSLYDSSDD